MNADIFILARSDSNRLPGKHLLDINGKPAIKNLVERLRKSTKKRKIVVCTTKLESDDTLVEFLKKESIEYFRGSEKDILQRFLNAAIFFGTEIIIDVSGDKIYTDPNYVDKIISIMHETDVDFIRGNNSPSQFDPGAHFIHGMIPGGIRTKALRKICKLKKTNNTESGYTEFFIKLDFIKKKYLVLDVDIEFIKKIKLDLDYNEDLQLARIFFKELGSNFHMKDVLELFLKKPKLRKNNKHLIDKWKENYSKKVCDTSLKI